MQGNTTEITDPNETNAPPKKFAFDHSYWSHDGYKERSDGYLEPASSAFADQKKVFDDLGQGVLINSWKGYNCSLFAYGQTGSGKSYSMVGYGANKGIVPIFCEELFSGIASKRETAKKDEEYQVFISMTEIYNEQVRDLLNPKSNQKGGLKVRQHPSKGFYVEMLKSFPVNSYNEINNRINQGTTNRTVASTNMNATSSRAHTIVAIQFIQKTPNPAGQSMTKTSIVNLVDLAGSERADATGATGDRLKEGSMINQSLSTLGNVIKALADIAGGKTKVIVPFRDSILTKLLQNALGGNSKTVMIAALSPASINHDETLSTLRFADRAKAIKTKAIVNESPTDRLIRELREENARLMEMMKKGGVSHDMLGGDAKSAGGYTEDEVNEMKKAMEEQLKSNQEEMESMKQTWQQRMKEAEKENLAKLDEEKKKQTDRKVVPHLWNLNEDPSLAAMIIHFCRLGTTRVGNKNASPQPEILLNGLSVQKEHATIKNNKGTVSMTPIGNAKIVVNGKAIAKETQLHHNDRIMFGSNHLYVFHHPQDEAKQVKAGKKAEAPTFESAQEEMAKESGLVKGGAGQSKDDMLLHDDLVHILPMVNEANAISEELDKKMKFEVALVSPQARGLKHGRTEVMVIMTNLGNGNEWLWDRNKFINRKFLMQEMYQNFMEGDEKWDLPKEKDPFWEPADAEWLIGTVQVLLQSLAHKIDLQESLSITDYKGIEQGVLNVEIIPCNKKWELDEDDFVETPDELISKPLHIKIKVPSARGLPAKFHKAYCQYKFYLDDKYTVTQEMAGTINPSFNFEKKLTINPVTKQFLDFVTENPLVIEVWGRQKDEGFKSNKNATTAQLMDQSGLAPRHRGRSPSPAGRRTDNSAAQTPSVAPAQSKSASDQEVKKLTNEVNVLKKKTEAAEGKLTNVQNLLSQAKSKGVKTLKVEDIEKMLKGTVPQISLSDPKAEKNRKEALGNTTSAACILQ